MASAPRDLVASASSARFDHHLSLDHHAHPYARQKHRRTGSKPLQRNQACSTCRSRKVRCDATKPACGACKRSAAAHGEDPSLVVCQYESEDSVSFLSPSPLFDDPLHFHPASPPSPPSNPSCQDPSCKPSAKVAILEQKIAALEKSISELEITNQQAQQESGGLPFAFTHALPLPATHSSGAMDSLAEHSIPLSCLDWPSTLPNRSLSIQMVMMYFNPTHSAGGAIQFIDSSSLISRLALPSYHPSFPNPTLIHAVLMKTFQSHSSHLGLDRFIVRQMLRFQVQKYWHSDCTTSQLLTDEDLGGQRTYRAIQNYHEQCFKSLLNQSLMAGSGLLEVVQALNIYTDYVYQSGRLLDAWIHSGLAVRFSVPLGLSQLESCPPQLSALKPKPRVILSRPISTTDKYERASTFWYGFELDRLLSVCSGKPHSISEEDVSTLLPIKPGSTMSTLEPIVGPLAAHPLSISNPHILNCTFQSLSTSAAGSGGAFICLDEQLRCVELISVLLLGRVSDWLRRSADPVGFNIKTTWKVPEDGDIPDLRHTVGFIDLDQQIQAFKISIKPRLVESVCEPVPPDEQSGLRPNQTTKRTKRKISCPRLMIRLVICLSEILLNECFLNLEDDGRLKLNLQLVNDQFYEASIETLRCLESATGGDDEEEKENAAEKFNPFFYFCWMVGIRSWIRLLVMDEMELMDIKSMLPSTTLAVTPLTSTLASTCRSGYAQWDEAAKGQLNTKKQQLESSILGQIEKIETMMRLFSGPPSGRGDVLDWSSRSRKSPGQRSVNHNTLRDNALWNDVEGAQHPDAPASNSGGLDHCHPSDRSQLREYYLKQSVHGLLDRFKVYRIPRRLAKI